MSIPLNELASYKIAYLVKNKRLLLDNKMAEIELSRTQWQVLSCFGFSPKPCTQKDLLQALEIDRAHLARTLEGLEQRLLIKRKPVPGNRRTLYVSLTQKGEALLTEVEKTIQWEYGVLVNGLNAQEREMLDSLLTKMTKNILSEIEQL